MSKTRQNAIAWTAAVLVSVGAAAVVHDHTKMDSASMDEPAHLQAGYLQVFQHTALTNMEHPPLAKDFAGLGLKLLGEPVDVPAAPGFDFARSGFDFVFHNRISPDRLLAAGRAPMLLFFAALLLLVFGAARRRFGTASGFFALGLVAFEPNFLAHAGIVHTDVPVAFFWLAFVLAWARLLEAGGAWRLIGAGALLGGALATKFSGIYLIPTAVLVALGVRLADRQSEERRTAEGFVRAVFRDLRALVLTLVVAIAVLLAIYQPAVSGMKVADQQALIHRYVHDYLGSPRTSDFIASLAPYSRGLAHYLGGLASVGLQSTAGENINFLNGKVALRGFPSYFFVAFFVKTGPAFLLAVGLELVLALARRKDRLDAILWLPVAYYFLFSVGSNYNIGVRHLLPIYPFLAIAASRSISDLAALPRWMPAIAGPVFAAGLCGLQALTAARAHPHELSYFNLFGGGMENGYRVLSDSNVDWGLDLRRLADEIRRRGVRDPTIVYFGGDSPLFRTATPGFFMDSGTHGSFVAISASLWDFGPPYYALYGRVDLARELSALKDRLGRKGRPIGRIGGSTLLFELPPESAP